MTLKGTATFEKKHWTFQYSHATQLLTLELHPTMNKEGAALFLNKGNYANEIISGQISEKDTGTTIYKYTGENVFFLLSYQLFSLEGYRFQIRGVLVFPKAYQKSSGVRVYAKELPYIFDTRRSIVEPESKEIGVTILPHEQTCSHVGAFTLQGINVNYQFCLSRYRKFRDPCYPIHLDSLIEFSFAETDDYVWVNSLYEIAEKLLKYLCYRENVTFKQVQIKAGDQFNGILLSNTKLQRPKHEERDSVIETQYIDFDFLNTSCDSVLQAIADNDLYLLHIPSDHADRHYINGARILLVSAAFEWEHKKLFGIREPSEARKNTQEIVMGLFDDCDAINNATGKAKKYFQQYKDDVTKDRTDLSEKILQALKTFDSIIFQYISKRIPCSEDEKSRLYSEISTNVRQVRNKYAHGEIQREVAERAAFDIVFIEWLVYCMQLRRLGVNDDNISAIIKQLFDIK